MRASEARISASSHVLIPPEVREKLQLRPGDHIRFVQQDNAVLLEKAPQPNADDPFVSFAEWRSEIDDNAYRDL